MAARMIDTDTSPESSLVLCNKDHGGCGWRAIYRTRAKALAAGETHRAEFHPELVTAAEGQARQRARQGQGVAA